MTTPLTIKNYVRILVNQVERIAAEVIGDTPGGVYDHGELEGLLDYDHPQYMPRSAGPTWPFTGDVYWSSGKVLRGALKLTFDDYYRTLQSTWSWAGINLSDAQTDWSQFYSRFGHVSLLRAMLLAGDPYTAGTGIDITDLTVSNTGVIAFGKYGQTLSGGTWSLIEGTNITIDADLVNKRLTINGQAGSGAYDDSDVFYHSGSRPLTGNGDADGNSWNNVLSVNGLAATSPLALSGDIGITLSDAGRAGSTWSVPLRLSPSDEATSIAAWSALEVALGGQLSMVDIFNGIFFHDGRVKASGDWDINSHSLSNVVNITSNDADMLGINSTHLDGEYAICGHVAVQVTGEDDPIAAGLDVSDTGSVVACTDSTNPLATISNEISAGLVKCALTRTDAGAVSAQVNVGADGVSFSDAAQLASTWNTDLKVARSGVDGVADYDALKVNAVTELSIVEMFNQLFGRGGIQADGGELIKGPVNFVSGSNIVFTPLDDEEGFRADVAIGNVRIYPSSASTNPGTATGDVADLATWNENAIYHVQGVEGTPGMSTIFVVPGVVNFDLVQMRARYVTGGIGHVDVDLYNLVTEAWDTVGYYLAADSYEVKPWPVANGADYVSLDGNVQIRVRNPQSGQTTDELSVDWLCVVRSAAGAQDITLQTAYNGGRSAIINNGPVSLTVGATAANGGLSVSALNDESTSDLVNLYNASLGKIIWLDGLSSLNGSRSLGNQIWSDKNCSFGKTNSAGFNSYFSNTTYVTNPDSRRAIARIAANSFDDLNGGHQAESFIEVDAQAVAEGLASSGIEINAWDGITISSGYGDVNVTESRIVDVKSVSYGDAPGAPSFNLGALSVNFSSVKSFQEFSATSNITSVTFAAPPGIMACQLKIIASGGARTITGFSPTVSWSEPIDPDLAALSIASGRWVMFYLHWNGTSWVGTALRQFGT